MHSKELRSGNLVLYKGKVKEVWGCIYSKTELLPQGYDGDFQGNIIEEALTAFLEPIPLTEEWLTKSGFENHIGYWHHQILGSIMIYPPYKDAKHLLVKTLEGSKLTSLKYVHQLQNLYFALTGQDLEFNL